MGKSKLRKVNIDGRNYLWSLKHHHDLNVESECLEVLKVYLDGYKASSLNIHFDVSLSIKDSGGKESPHWEVGYPESGVAWKSGNEEIRVNLNRPGVVVVLIRYALLKLWQPEVQIKQTIYKNGFNLLEILEFPNETK